MATAGASRTHLSARTHHGLELIPLEQIHYFTADQKYVSVHHSKGSTLVDESLKQLEDEFGERFLRIHRSTLVAVSHIERLETTEDGARIWLKDVCEPLPVSRRHLSGVRRFIRG